MDKAEAQVAEVVQSLEVAETHAERKDLLAQLQAAEEELQRFKAEGKKVQVRNLYVADHPPLLDDALENARSRLMIISPWIKGKVVNDTFIRRLERLLTKGVRVLIGYGINEQPTQNPFSQDVAAVNNLKALASKYPNFSLNRLGNTHAKVLIKDSDFAAITSFNWLSFKGDPQRTFRDEQGTLLQVSDLVNQKFAELEPRFL
jgi:phosphatidylserine/phosphatidylglycerophosphate/cardiolipin synthase-like enzyme